MSDYKSSSLYYDTPQTNFALDIYQPRYFPFDDDADDVVMIEKSYERRPDLMSYDRYGSVAYWWVFMARNKDIIKDPVFGFTAGLEIYAPTKRTVQEYLV